MAFLGGLLGAAVISVPTWLLAGTLTSNLPAPDPPLIALGLALANACIGFLIGAAIVRRATDRAPHLLMFSALAAAIGGGLAGALTSLTITAAYMTAFAQWPVDILNQILVVLAFPVFAALGWFAGASFGFLGGLVGGTLLRAATLGKR